MANLNIPAMTYLVISIVFANTLSMLILTAAALVMSFWASLQTWQLFFPGQPFEFWQENYFRQFQSGPVVMTEAALRSEEHTSELQSLMRISYAVFCLTKKIHYTINLY